MLASYKNTMVFSLFLLYYSKSLNVYIYIQGVGVVANMFAEEEWTDNLPDKEQTHSVVNAKPFVEKVDF